MAKFKVGDEVDVVGTRMKNKIISKVIPHSGTSSDYELKGVPMTWYQETMLTPALNPRNSVPRSTNPVVANAMEATASNADGNDYRAIANETRKVLAHLKAADDITVANVMKSINDNGELASKSNEMWKHISEARKLANFIIQYNG